MRRTRVDAVAAVSTKRDAGVSAILPGGGDGHHAAGDRRAEFGIFFADANH
jgi:hypothetical protein